MTQAILPKLKLAKPQMAVRDNCCVQKFVHFCKNTCVSCVNYALTTSGPLRVIWVNFLIIGILMGIILCYLCTRNYIDARANTRLTEMYDVKGENQIQYPDVVVEFRTGDPNSNVSSTCEDYFGPLCFVDNVGTSMEYPCCDKKMLAWNKSEGNVATFRMAFAKQKRFLQTTRSPNIKSAMLNMQLMPPHQQGFTATAHILEQGQEYFGNNGKGSADFSEIISYNTKNFIYLRTYRYQHERVENGGSCGEKQLINNNTNRYSKYTERNCRNSCANCTDCYPACDRWVYEKMWTEFRTSFSTRYLAKKANRAGKEYSDMALILSTPGRYTRIKEVQQATLPKWVADIGGSLSIALGLHVAGVAHALMWLFSCGLCVPESQEDDDDLEAEKGDLTLRLIHAVTLTALKRLPRGIISINYLEEGLAQLEILFPLMSTYPKPSKK